MTEETERQAVNQFELEHFERNRYFQGKLMTAHDMATEQEYHASRFETINKLVSGTGIVTGLSITDYEFEDEELRVTVSPGVAIDGNGRPIVVRTATTRTVPTGDSDRVYLYLVFSEEPKDPVPVPGVEATNGEESEESRTLEIFELVAKDTPPASSKTTPILDFPEVDETDDFQKIANKIVDSYHKANRQRAETVSEEGIFLGAFEQLPEGDWGQHEEETRRRPFVYDNDMLFSLFLSQFVGGDGVPGAEESTGAEFLESELDQIDEFATQLQDLEIEVASIHDALQERISAIRSDLESEIESVETTLRTEGERRETRLQDEIDRAEERLDSEIEQLHDALQTQAELNAYRALKTAVRAYDDTAETFEHDGEVSRQALSLIETIQQGLVDRVDESADQFSEFVDTAGEEIDELTALLEESATKESYSRFVETVDRLVEVQSGDATFIDLVTAFDRVSQTATLLEPRYEIHPE